MTLIVWYIYGKIWTGTRALVCKCQIIFVCINVLLSHIIVWTHLNNVVVCAMCDSPTMWRRGYVWPVSLWVGLPFISWHPQIWPQSQVEPVRSSNLIETRIIHWTAHCLLRATGTHYSQRNYRTHPSTLACSNLVKCISLREVQIWLSLSFQWGPLIFPPPFFLSVFFPLVWLESTI